MTVASPRKSVTYKGQFFLLPSELPDYCSPPILNALLDGPAGEDAALAFLREMLGEDGMRRFVDGCYEGDLAREDLGPFVGLIYREYGWDVA